jgi:hypothetical protein
LEGSLWIVVMMKQKGELRSGLGRPEKCTGKLHRAPRSPLLMSQFVPCKLPKVSNHEYYAASSTGKLHSVLRALSPSLLMYSRLRMVCICSSPNMRGKLLLRNLARTAQSSPSRTCLYRTLSTSPLLFKSSGSKYDSATTSRPPNESGSQEGESARTDVKVSFGYPEGESLSRPALRGHGGRHFKPTLASFSLDRKVAVLTGAARGLGLVMAQALMLSGADIAIVDLNGEFAPAHLYEEEAKLSNFFA